MPNQSRLGTVQLVHTAIHSELYHSLPELEGSVNEVLVCGYYSIFDQVDELVRLTTHVGVFSKVIFNSFYNLIFSKLNSTLVLSWDVY